MDHLLTEARNPAGEEYGVPRMKKLAANCHKKSPNALIADCLKDLQNFTSGTKPHDDLTLLAIQRIAEAMRSRGRRFETNARTSLARSGRGSPSLLSV